MEEESLVQPNKMLEEFNHFLNGKRVALLGIGVSNIPLLDYLHEKKSIVTVFDKRNEDEFSRDVLEKIQQYGMETSFGEDYLEKLNNFTIIFRSPSCRPDLPEIEKEIERGALVTTEIELLIKMTPAKVIGITGSDGKTTTSTLIYEILKKAEYNCYLGGNIGIPLFMKLPEMTKEDIVVLELSSFQLMDMDISPNISVITNISPNHLDIHTSYEEYIDAKKHIFQYQDNDGVLILNYDNQITKEFEKESKGEVRFFSRLNKPEKGIIIEDGIIKEIHNKLRKHIINTNDIFIKGNHNYENIACAIAATYDLVPDPNIYKEVFSEFRGIEHRIEFIREIEEVKWYNDSIASSPTRTIAGLNSFSEDIVLIAGGYDKNLDYTPLAKPIIEKVKTLILVGDTKHKILKVVQEELEAQGKEIDIYVCEKFSQTVELAKKHANPGEVVLMSPASPSFDMFKNFDERGKVFKKLVNHL